MQKKHRFNHCSLATKDSEQEELTKLAHMAIRAKKLKESEEKEILRKQFLSHPKKNEIIKIMKEILRGKK